ncbi:hypothetical protein FQN50_000509 [Emmonsiellopsis sp. PD_5]|nr:hypothetical protein FQN50_000509 [Emmonsiellopsis sp. PD_5]
MSGNKGVCPEWTEAELEAERRSFQQRAERYRQMRKFMATSSSDYPSSIRAAYLELFWTLQSIPPPPHQPEFVNNLCEYYGDTGPGIYLEVWDVVFGTFQRRNNLTAAHIFPWCMGQRSMDYIFGEQAEGQLNSARNGLFLHPDIKNAFDKHQVVVVPDGPQTTPQEYKFLVLENGLFDCCPTVNSDLKYKDLHGRRLRFQPDNPFRPRACYLYFHYLQAVLERIRSRNSAHGTQSSNRDMLELLSLWTIQGKYLRKNLILAFIEAVGHGLPDEGKQDMLKHSNAEVAPDELARAKWSVERLDLDSDDEDDDDDDWH